MDILEQVAVVIHDYEQSQIAALRRCGSPESLRRALWLEGYAWDVADETEDEIVCEPAPLLTPFVLSDDNGSEGWAFNIFEL